MSSGILARILLLAGILIGGLMLARILARIPTLARALTGIIMLARTLTPEEIVPSDEIPISDSISAVLGGSKSDRNVTRNGS